MNTQNKEMAVRWQRRSRDYARLASSWCTGRLSVSSAAAHPHSPHRSGVMTCTPRKASDPRRHCSTRRDTQAAVAVTGPQEPSILHGLAMKGRSYVAVSAADDRPLDQGDAGQPSSLRTKTWAAPLGGFSGHGNLSFPAGPLVSRRVR